MELTPFLWFIRGLLSETARAFDLNKLKRVFSPYLLSGSVGEIGEQFPYICPLTNAVAARERESRNSVGGRERAFASNRLTSGFDGPKIGKQKELERG